jgi:arsenate reductase
MAEGFLKSFDSQLEVYSAGTSPSTEIHPKAKQVMGELNIDISNGQPQHVDSYLDSDFDYVITVCGGAKENCPVFMGKVKKQIHIGFDDPAETIGTEDEILNEFRRIRDEIKRDFFTFFKNHINK